MQEIFSQNTPDILPIGFVYLRLFRNEINQTMDYVFLDINDEFEKLIGVRKEQILGKLSPSIFGADAVSTIKWLDTCERAIRIGKTQKIIQWIEFLSGYYKVTVTPLNNETVTIIFKKVLEYDENMYFDYEKNILENSFLKKDIGKQNSDNYKNDIFTEQFQSIFYRSTAVILIIDPAQGKIIDANSQACKFYGYSKTEIEDLPIKDTIAPNFDEVDKYYMLIEEEKNSRYIYTHRLKSGEARLVDIYSCPIYGYENVLLCSIIFDVTDRELYKKELFKEKQVFKATLKWIGDGVVITDKYGNIISLNSAVRNVLGYTSNKLEGRKFSDVFTLINEKTSKPIIDPIQEVLDTGKVALNRKYTILLGSNDIAVPIENNSIPIKSETGEISGVLTVFRDIRQQNEQINHIEFLRYHDPLTGLYNRIYIEENMTCINVQENLPLAVVMGDVNGLKIANDVYGNLKGDELLKCASNIIKKNCRTKDIVARWGGDEFAIFMPRTTLEVAETIVQKIKQDINDDNSCCHLSISFGCYVKNILQENIEEIMGMSEEYMYNQKLLDEKSYRNAVINALLATLYEKSNETEEHSKRLEKYCYAMGKKLGLSSKEMDDLSLLAILHDIGKVSITHSILEKSGALTPDEWEDMKRHTEIGHRIALATPELSSVADFILYHHERWDGKGYPKGLEGEDIPLACRILSVADAFDAMTNDRVYRKAMDKETAIEEIIINSGTQFDPEIARVFIQLFRENAEIFE